MSVEKEFETIQQLMKDDFDYAWGWHCNIACAAMDEGVDHATANKIACRFMKNAFDISTPRSIDEYRKQLDKEQGK